MTHTMNFACTRLPTCVLAALFVVFAATAQAEDLVVTLSERTVDITSNFTGSAITIFGAVRRDGSTVPRASAYDVVVTVSGPPADRVTRLKDRIFGVWINRFAQEFDDVPSAYSVLSNRPVADIAHPAILGRFGIGIDHLLVDEESTQIDAQDGGREPDAPDDNDAQATADPVDTQANQAPLAEHVFERAFLRLQRESRQYQEDPRAVSMIDETLFRARAAFPADVPLGNFEVRVFLFSGGVLLAQEEVAILVRKTGFEQIIFRASQRDPLIYGLAAVLLALFTGWLGGVVFRRT